MGRVYLFEIHFSRANGVYYAGELLEGQVLLELKETLNLRGIKIHYEGQTSVEWTQGTGDRRRYYRAFEKYFEYKELLFGIWHTAGSTTQDLPAGRHEFPFRFQLPFNLPTSFESYTGHVRYVVSCYIDMPYAIDPAAHRPFTVLSILDLNHIPGAMQRLQGTKEKTLGCCGSSGPITASISIEKAGYVPGEIVKIYAEINNTSDTLIDKSYVNLIMHTTFTSRTPYVRRKEEKKEVARITHPAIPANGRDVWSGDELVVPPLPPSFLQGCSFIDVRYVLTLQVDPSGLGFNLEIPFEVIIGTIPVYTYYGAPTNLPQPALTSQPIFTTPLGAGQAQPIGNNPVP